MEEPFDVVAVGAGPGGYVAAIHAAQLGLKTALVERHELGGICLNLGCVPSKAMLRGVELLHLTHLGGVFGLAADRASLNYGQLVAHRNRTVAKLRQGVTNLLRGNGVTVVDGTAHLLNAHRLEVEMSDGVELLAFQHLIIATGSRPTRPPIPGIDLPGVIDSDVALELTAAPRRVVIIGGGAVGVEWAEIWRGFGAEVTVLELLPRLLPNMDAELARELVRSFARKNIDVKTNATVQSIEKEPSGLEVHAVMGEALETIAADTILVATGRQANTESLGLDQAGVRVERGGIPTDEHMRTNLLHVYAVGDVTGRYLLAHVASHQGIIAAETIAGRQRVFDERAVPSVIFTDPEIASVGLSEEEAAGQGIAVRVGRFPFAGSSRAVASGESAGLVKLLAREDSGEILGAHIAGPRAGDLISEAALAIQLRATLNDLVETIHPHPTFGEALMEAAWAALGTPIHIPPRHARPTRAPR